MVPIMGTKRMAIGPNLYLGLQPICFVGFWVSYCGWFYTQQPEYTPVTRTLLSTSQSHFLS